MIQLEHRWRNVHIRAHILIIILQLEIVQQQKRVGGDVARLTVTVIREGVCVERDVHTLELSKAVTSAD